MLCALVGWMMRPESGEERTPGRKLFSSEPQRAPAPGPDGQGPRSASSLDFAPTWGALPLSAPEPPAPPAKPEPPAKDPEPPPLPPAAPQAPVDINPAAVKAAVQKLGKAAGGAAAAAAGGGGRTLAPVASFEKRERIERGEEKPTLGGHGAAGAPADPEKGRVMRAVIQAGDDGSLQHFGLTKEHLFALDKAGIDLSPYVQADGTLKITEKEARLLSQQLGLVKGQLDAAPAPNNFAH